jgi:hypothetical protein
MKEIIETSLLEFEKSTFLIDLVKHGKGQLYIHIQQSIHRDDMPTIQQEIKINPSVLDEIIEVLKNYLNQIPNQQPKSYPHLSSEIKQAIQDRYLKGISINDLALQFDIKPQLIQQILENRGIEIVSNTSPKINKRYYRRKK